MNDRIKSFLLRYRRVLIVAVHLFLIGAAYCFAFFARFDFSPSHEFLEKFYRTLPLAILVKLSVFYFYGLFRGLWRYVSMTDLWQIIKANSLASVLFILSVIFLFGLHMFPRSVFVIDYIFCTSFIAAIRFFTRLFRERFRKQLNLKQKKVLIIGAGDGGILALKEYRHNPSMGEVVGFVDDDPVKLHNLIYGVKVLGACKDITDIVDRWGVEEIVVAIPSASGETIRSIINHCQVLDAKLKIIPGFIKILNGDFEIKPREVKPEDLLGRETVSIVEGDIQGYIRNKRVLVTGAAGSIGSELCRQLAHFSPEKIVLIDHNENNIYFLEIELRSRHGDLDIRPVVGDINDISLLKHIFSHEKPQVVFHVAAFKHVPLMQENPIAAVKNNCLGTRNIIYASHHYKAERFVLISTDKAVNPINVMGLTKRLAEILLQAKAKHSKTKFMAVRFGNVLGSDGSVVPLFKRQIENGGPLTVTHPDISRYFMSIKEAVLLVLQAGAMGEGGEIFILDMGEQIKIIDLARDLVALSGMELGKDISFEYIGLRPGEKMKEELLVDKDKDRVTKHDKIFIKHADDFDLGILRKHMRELKGYVDMAKEDKVVKKLKEIIFSVKDGQ